MKAFLLLLLAALTFGTRATAQSLKPALIQTMAGEKVGYQRGPDVVVAPKYDMGNEFIDGYATVAIGDRHGIIDSAGVELLMMKCRALGYPSEGLVSVSFDGKKYGFANLAGQLVVPCTFDDAGDFHEGVATVVRAGKCALINKKGVPITLFKYQGIEDMHGGIARVCLKNDSRDGVQFSNFYGFLNRQGVEITKLNCYGEKSKNTGNGHCIAAVRIPGRAPNFTDEFAEALVNKAGKVVIPASAGYSFGEFTDRYLRVHKDFPEGVVDYSGRVVLPVNFWRITNFAFGPNDSLAQAYTSDRDFFYVNRQWQCQEFDGVACPKY